MTRWRGSWAVWLGCLPLLAQAPTQKPAPAPPARPLADQIAEFLATPAAERRPASWRALARAVSGSTLTETARLEQLTRLQTVAAEFDADSQAFVAMVVALCALQLGDHDRVIANAELAESAPGLSKDGEWARVSARKLLYQTALNAGDVERAYRLLARYAEVVDPVTAGLAEADLLLRIGMVRAVAVVLDRIEAAPAEQEQRLRIACLRLQELLANEQLEAARSEAGRLLAARGLAVLQADQVRLTEAFAMARLGDDAAAEARLRTMLGRADLDRSYATLARAELAMLRLQRGDPVEAAATELGPDRQAALASLPDWSLAARARCELARGNTTASDELVAVHAALLQRHTFLLRQWRATPVQSDGVAFLQWSVRRELLVCLCACELALGGDGAATRCLGYLLEADACGSLARRLGAPAGDPATLLQRALPPNGLLVWFLPAPRGSLALLAEADSVRAITLPSDVPLRKLVRELRQSVRDETVLGDDWAQEFAARTAPLAAWAFAPALREALARTRRITILGRELLTGLPFEFLPSPADPAQCFGLTHAIEYVPSATLATMPAGPASATAQHPARLTVLAATSQTTTCAGRYPECTVPVDRADLAAMAAAVDPTVLTIGLEASAAELAAALPDTDVLVLLAHGRRRHPEDAAGELQRQQPLGIVLGDGFFGPERLRTPPRMPPVVVLASCGTARAGVDRGEDGQLFGTAWLAAGSQAVLSAEGDLELRATERLLAAFLTALAAGVEPAEALRQARVAVATEPRFAHPAHYCALRLDARGPVVLQLPAAPADRDTWRWLLVGALGAAAMGIAGVWIRRRGARVGLH